MGHRGLRRPRSRRRRRPGVSHAARAHRWSTSCAMPAPRSRSRPRSRCSTSCSRCAPRCPACGTSWRSTRRRAGPDVLAFSELEALGRALPAEGWEAAALMARPDDLATIIYTSGTTGNPKGVMLTHGNITSNVIAGLLRIPIQEDPGQQECLSFLPLSHIFERMAGHYLMTHAGAIINYAGSIDTVSADMGEIRPTLMCSVPRLYEKIYARVQENAMAGSAVKRQIFRWAKRVGETCVDLDARGQAGAAGARRPARRGRPAGVPEAARPHRQPASLLRVGRRPAQCRHRAVLPRGEAADPRGIRPHRDVARHLRQHLQGPPARHRGQAASRHRGEDRGGRRDRDARAQRDEGVLQQAGRDAGGARSRRMVPYRRHRRDRRRRVPA